MKNPALVCIARHGETDWNIAGILQGWSDVPINDVGRRQAREFAAACAEAGFAAIWSSPLIRALETAEIIAAELGAPPPFRHDGLKERDFGAIQGVPKAELAELNPVLLQQILKRNPAAFFEEGETMDDFARRVLEAVADIGESHAGESVLVITHGWVMDVLTRHVRGLQRNAILNLKRRNGECIWLEVEDRSILARDTETEGRHLRP
ncbi:MAG: histidine phosphatase family protein [Betaproteobacteria bacterium]|nr:histidine phosphatase family protein [Betaproteobacteria bacterium]